MRLQMSARLIAATCGGLVLALACAPVAVAGHFHLYSCTDPVTHAPLPTDGWSPTPGLVVYNENNCPSSNGIEVYLNPGVVSGTSSYMFSAPPGLTITAATLYREGVINGRARGLWASPENNLVESNIFDVCQGAEETPCYLGNVGILHECKPLAFCGPAPYSPYDTLPVPSTHLPASHLYVDVQCLQQGCDGYEDLRSADIQLSQPTPPTAVATGGSLTSAMTLRGVMDVAITADDAASGVFEAVLQSNGRTISKQVIDANNGKCEPYGEASDGTTIFLYAQPCPLGISSVDVPIDTSALPDGPQQVGILVTDAAGNATSILNRNVTVENSGAYLVRVHREELERALAARGACNGECDEHAAITSADATLARRPFARRFSRSGLTLRGQLLDHAGLPMANATVELTELPADEGAKPAVLARATTDAQGQWSFRVPRGPSRSLTVGYRARANDATFAAQITLHERVSAGVTLQAPRSTRPGRVVKFVGRLLGGFVPRKGALVSLEIRYAGAWREIALLRSDRRGRFGYRYTFAPIGAATYRFRAQVPAMPGYPFQAGASQSLGIHLLP